MSNTPADETETESTPRQRETEVAEDESGIGRLGRRNFLKGIAATSALSGAGAEALTGDVTAASTAETGWEPKPPQLETPWTSEVGPDNAHPEYPRPQMVREQWKNLNGVWQFAGASEDDPPPIGQELDERILVPYPVESGLSGIKRHETWMWYRRQFTVPDDWVIPTATEDDGDEQNPNAQRLLLHFERVDWEATVYVNGEKVTSHQGGYDHFTADVTDALVEGGPQELVVGVYDPTGIATEPKGYQPKGRQGVGGNTDGGSGGLNSLWKTPASGIWDTVWLEPVPDAHVEGLEMTPDLDSDSLQLTVEASTDDATVVATAFDENGEKAGRVVGPANEELELAVEDATYWTPENPYLYDLDVKLRRRNGSKKAQKAGGGTLLDHVESYFGLRSIGKETVDETARPTLNGEMVYHIGTLDSGYWPDGIYTAPTDEAIVTHLQYQKDLGYNMIRMHSKLETRRWFYHTDRLGLLVWQDIPNMDEDLPDPGGEPPLHGPPAHENFKREVEDMVTQHDTHPSMAVWIPFNEGWGIINSNTDFVKEVTALIQELDPERLVDPMSGHNVGSNQDPEVGDVTDVHEYPGPAAPAPDPDRISANGEYTSPSLQLPEHTFGDCGSNIDAETFLEGYLASVDELRDLMVAESLSASVYTATTDLNGVCNGMVTYDRKVVKPTRAENGLERVRSAHEDFIEQSRLAMGNVDIDVDIPEAYVSGQLLGNPKPFEVTATVSNPESDVAADVVVEDVQMSLDGEFPDDWSVAAETPTSGDVGEGESISASWTVTPDSTADGDVGVEVTIDYGLGGERYRYDASEVISAAQLAYWRFENNTEDDSSYNTALALQNGASFDDEVAVEADYSMRLDGDDDYALIAGSAFHEAFTQRTISMWVNPDDTTGSQVLYNEGGYFNGLGLRIVDGELEAMAKNNGNPGTVSGPFTQTDWTHVALVFDSGRLSLYVNGEELATNPDVGFSRVSDHVADAELGSATTTTPWRFDDATAHNFGGNVDATAVYNYALSDTEVQAVATRSFALDAPTLYTTGSNPDPFTVKATFSDLRAGDGTTFENLSMSVSELPDGWSSSPTSDTEYDAVPDGESVAATWDITPSSSTTGSVEIEVTASYESDGEQFEIVSGATLDTLSSIALAEWRFDGTTEDTSGNGHTATLENGASFDDQTVVQGSHSVALDGDDDFIDLAEGGDDFLSSSFTERTISMWVNPDDTTGSQVLYNEGALFNGMILRINDGTLQAGTKSNGNPGTVSGPFTQTDWTHVALVFDSGRLSLYVNGEELATNPDVGYTTASGGFWGGELGGAEVSPFDGWAGFLAGNIDVSAIYPIALSEDLISSLAGSY